MNFGFSQEISEDVYSKANILTSISEKAKPFFKEREYGSSIKTFTIGIICVAPNYDFFFKNKRKGYTMAKRLLEYDIKLEYERFKNSDKGQIKEMVARSVIDSLGIIEELEIKDFDLKLFREDLILFFKE
jgi:hypothetical protein